MDLLGVGFDVTGLLSAVQPTDRQLLPIVTYGLDELVGRPHQTLLNVDDSKTQAVTISGVAYQAPLDVRVDSSSSTKMGLSMGAFYESNSYSAKLGAMADVLRLASAKLKLSRTVKKTRQATLSVSYLYFTLYTLALGDKKSPNRTDALIAKLNQLKALDPQLSNLEPAQMKRTYADVFRVYGTDYVTSLDCGGVIEVSVDFSSDSRSNSTNLTASASLLINAIRGEVGASAQFSKLMQECNATISISARPSLDLSFEWKKGDSNGELWPQIPLQWANWKAAVGSHPAVIGLRSSGIQELCYHEKYIDPQAHHVDHTASVDDLQFIQRLYDTMKTQREAYVAEKLKEANSVSGK